MSFNEKISDESAKNFFQLAISIAKKIGKITLNELKIRSATDQYAENYLRRFGTIKVLGMAEPIPLKDLYTDVEIISPNYRVQSQHIEDLETNFRKKREHSGTGLNRSNGIQVANQRNRLTVLGAPGSGKSTFLRKLGLECLTIYTNPNDEIFQHNCIPVIIELKKFRDEKITLFELILSELDIAGFPDSNRFLKKALEDGNLLILLDGIDEVPEILLTIVLEQIRDFSDKYHKNRYVTSCRTAFYKNYIPGFTDIEICAFNNEQIEAFINNWFSFDKDEDSQIALIFQRLLFSHENEATLELARTPLLLTYLCLTFDDSQRLPINRSSLYKQALNILMQKWAAEKRIHNEDIYRDLNIELETEMLANIAADFYVDDKIFFFQNDVKAKIKDFLDKRLSVQHLNVGKILYAIEIQQGILVERSPDIYSFSHLTIQEFLTAHYYNSPIRYKELVENYLLEIRWREVFLLITGLGDPNDMLLMMIEFLNAFALKDNIISKVIKWIGENLFTNENCELNAAKRVFLASLLIRYKRYERGIFNIGERNEIYADSLINSISSPFYDFFVFNLKVNITTKEATYILKEMSGWLNLPDQLSNLNHKILSIRPKKPLSKMPEGSRHAYRQEIVRELFNMLNIPPEIINLRKNLYNPLLKYFEGVNLLIDCAKNSTLTSKDVWEKICQSILSSNCSLEG